MEIVIRYEDDYYHEGFGVSGAGFDVRCCMSRTDIEALITLLPNVVITFEDAHSKKEWNAS
jgi:hypothetical protein